MDCSSFSLRRALGAALAVSAFATLTVHAQSEPSAAERIAPAEFGVLFPLGVYANLNAGPGGPDTIDLADLVGKKPVALCYWIAGHERSEETMQRLQEIADEAGAGKIAVLGVVTERPGREAPQIIERIRELELHVPVINDEGFRIGQQLLVQTVPSIAILDSWGALRLTNGGSLLQTVEYDLDVAGVVRRAARTGAVGTYGQLPRYYPVTEMVGQKCPDFKAPSLKDGVVQRWATLIDPESVNVLVFWSVDCPHCKKTLPQINAWLRENPKGINLISAARVSNPTEKVKTQEFCRFYDFVFPTLVDENQQLGQLFKVTSTPTMLIIRPDGVIDAALTGGTDFVTTFERKKEELLGSGES